jgi:hypothetical protein
MQSLPLTNKYEKKKLTFLLILFNQIFIFCRGTLPLQEISTAKQDLNKAKSYRAEKFAPTQYESASKSLLQAQSFSFDSNRNDAKTLSLANESSTLSKEALTKALPQYLNELREEVKQSEQSAIEANAEQLAPETLEQGKLLLNDGNELSSNLEDLEKINESILKYKSSIDSFEKARELSLSQGRAILDSTSDIERELNQIDSYSNLHKDKTNSLRNSYKEAIKLIQDDKLKQGMKQIDSIRLETSAILKEALLPYAKESAKLASDMIQSAEKKMNLRDFPISANASDNLAASKEAYNGSIDFLTKEKYYESIRLSEDSIKLAKSILDEPLDKSAVSEDKKQRESKKISSDDSKTNQKSEKETSYIKYIVKKKNPPETLWRIAADKKHFGDKSKWKKIYSVNKKTIEDPDKIYPNQILLIPKK